MAFWNWFKKSKPGKKTLPEGQPEEVTEDKAVSEKGHEPEVLKREKASEASDKPGEKRVSPERLEQENVIPATKAELKRYIQDCLDGMAESDRQIAKIKVEYEQVTEYLTDIQKIDAISGEDREQLLTLCRRINQLLKERNQYKNREMTITESQVRRFDRYQDDLIDQIKKMYENEMFLKAVESDMGHLEKEKEYQRYLQREIQEKQNALKGMSKALAVFIGALIVFFAAVYFALEVDMTYPYLGTLLLAAVSATVIFVEANKNRSEMLQTERCLSKAIGLLNKTKIKYVNTVSVLDYDRQKYGVKNANDFEELWGEYCKAKEYQRKFQENTQLLSSSNDAMQQLLAGYQVVDTEVWLVQTYAILDNREMVEIRHELNQRRGKLREQIKYNTENKEEFIHRLQKIGELHEEWNPEIEKLLG